MHGIPRKDCPPGQQDKAHCYTKAFRETRSNSEPSNDLIGARVVMSAVILRLGMTHPVTHRYRSTQQAKPPHTSYPSRSLPLALNTPVKPLPSNERSTVPRCKTKHHREATIPSAAKRNTAHVLNSKKICTDRDSALRSPRKDKD